MAIVSRADPFYLSEDIRKLHFDIDAHKGHINAFNFSPPIFDVCGGQNECLFGLRRYVGSGVSPGGHLFVCSSDTNGRSRRLSAIFNDDYDLPHMPVPSKLNALDGQLCPNLRLADASGFKQGSPNPIDTQSGEPRHYDSRQEHERRPSGHIPLGIQITLGALIFVSGLHNANNAFRLGERLTPATGSFYLLSGMAGVFLGMCIFLSGLLS